MGAYLSYEAQVICKSGKRKAIALWSGDAGDDKVSEATAAESRGLVFPIEGNSTQINVCVLESSVPSSSYTPDSFCLFVCLLITPGSAHGLTSQMDDL